MSEPRIHRQRFALGYCIRYAQKRCKYWCAQKGPCLFWRNFMTTETSGIFLLPKLWSNNNPASYESGESPPGSIAGAMHKILTPDSPARPTASRAAAYASKRESHNHGCCLRIPRFLHLFLVSGPYTAVNPRDAVCSRNRGRNTQPVLHFDGGDSLLLATCAE